MAKNATPREIADQHTNPVDLMDAACLAAGDPRYTRNSSLMTLLRGFQVAQREIREHQARLDARFERRADKAVVAPQSDEEQGVKPKRGRPRKEAAEETSEE